MVVTAGSYAGNNGDLVNNYYNTYPNGLQSSITPTAGLQEFYFGYSRICTTFSSSALTYDLAVYDNTNSKYLTPDYSSNIALQCSDVPAGWKSSNYVYWRYLTNSTSLNLSLLTPSTATGTPTLTFTPPVVSNNFMNWVTRAYGTASYTGSYYGVMTFTNYGKGTLSGTLTGTSNALILDFGFHLHNSNSFNFNITMTTQFQKPDALGAGITVSPTNWTTNASYTLSPVYPTFWVVKNQIDPVVISTDIVTGSYTDNSSNFYSVTSVTDSAFCSGFSNDLFSRGTSADHQISFQIQPCNSISRIIYYAYSQLNPGYISATNKTPTFYIKLGSGGWDVIGGLSVTGPITITASPTPTDGGGSAQYYYYSFGLGSSSDIYYIQVIWT